MEILLLAKWVLARRRRRRRRLCTLSLSESEAKFGSMLA
jgi:hypothetical protein